MMNRFACSLCCVLLILSSCTKTKSGLHFHGRITLYCNNQLSVSNLAVTLVSMYDDGNQIKGMTIGTISTDNNGYFSLITDVEQTGTFEYYRLYVAPATISNVRQYGTDTRFYNNTNDIEMNCEVGSANAYAFHIKNVSPFNNNDVLDSLVISDFLWPYSHTAISNLTGTTIDTTIYTFYWPTPTRKYRYSFTKNGVNTLSQLNTLPIPNCLDTSIINIYY